MLGWLSGGDVSHACPDLARLLLLVRLRGEGLPRVSLWRWDTISVKHLSIHQSVSARVKPTTRKQQGPTGRKTKGGEREEEGEKRGGRREGKHHKDRTGLQ